MSNNYLVLSLKEEFNERLFLLWIGLKEIIEEILGLGGGVKMGGLVERKTSANEEQVLELKE